MHLYTMYLLLCCPNKQYTDVTICGCGNADNHGHKDVNTCNVCWAYRSLTSFVRRYGTVSSATCV